MDGQLNPRAGGTELAIPSERHKKSGRRGGTLGHEAMFANPARKCTGIKPIGKTTRYLAFSVTLRPNQYLLKWNKFK